jgi:hypothetical protein
MKVSKRKSRTSRGVACGAMLTAIIAGALAFSAGAEEAETGTHPASYDFYANTKYPGPILRPDVELYKVRLPDLAGK